MHPLANIKDVDYKDIKNIAVISSRESLNELNVITDNNSLTTEEQPLLASGFDHNQININDIVVTPSSLLSHHIGETYEWITKPHEALYHQECPPYQQM